MEPDGTMIVVRLWFCVFVAWAAVQSTILLAPSESSAEGDIGREVAVSRHLQDGQEFQLSLQALIEHGKKLFTAVWTIQEGGADP